MVGHEIPHQVLVERGGIVRTGGFQQLFADHIIPPAAIKSLVQDTAMKDGVAVEISQPSHGRMVVSEGGLRLATFHCVMA